MPTTAFIWMLIAVCCFSVSTQGGEAAERPTLTIGGLPDSATAPYLWYSHCSNSFEGVLPHLVNRALGEVGYDAVYQPPLAITPEAWSIAINQLRNGDYDLAISLSATPIEGVVRGNEPVLAIRTSLLHRRGDHIDLEAPETLRERRGAVLDAGEYGTGYPILQSLTSMGVKAEARSGAVEVIADLRQGKLDFLIGDHYYLLGAAKLNDHYDALVFKPIAIEKGIYLGVREGSEWVSLVRQLDPVFVQYASSGLLEKFSRDFLLRWIQEDCTASKS